MKARTMAAALGLAAILLAAGAGKADITIDTVPIGNLGNAGEWSGASYGGYGADRICGAVGYEYEMGTFEVTTTQYVAFLDAVAGVDPHGLYNTLMWDGTDGCRIARANSGDGYTYSVAPEYASLPVNYVSWEDAARFANWLHNGQPTGAQDLTTTEAGSYLLQGGDLTSLTRSIGATWVIPTEDEWYKAAYHKNDGDTGNYYNYPTSSDTAPIKGIFDPDPGNHATFGGSGLTDVGAHESSQSPYGTFDQGGNVWEWTEEIVGTDRLLRGGSLHNASASLHAANRGHHVGAQGEYDASFGFRLAKVTYPEPHPGSAKVIGAYRLCDEGLTGAGVRIAMVEPGAAWSQHPALVETCQKGAADRSAADDHATRTAGIMVGVYSGLDGVPLEGRPYRGVAPRAELYSRGSTLSQLAATSAALIEDHQCDVINYSTGCYSNDWPDSLEEDDVNEAVEQLADNELVTVVAAAGNYGTGENGTGTVIPFPASAHNAIAVGSLKSVGGKDSAVWNTSTNNIPGPTLSPANPLKWPPGRSKPDIVAPADTWAPSTAQLGLDKPAFLGYTGSSAAAPHVAGAAALLIQAGRTHGGPWVRWVDRGGVAVEAVDPRAVKAALLTGADKTVKVGVVHTKFPRDNGRVDWYTSGPTQPLDHYLGAGGLDAYEAVQVLIGHDDPDAGRYRQTYWDSLNTDSGSDQHAVDAVTVSTSGMNFVATLVWHAHVDGSTVTLKNLDLELLRNGVRYGNAYSCSAVDNVEHIYERNLPRGNYSLRAYAFGSDPDPMNEYYALSYRLWADATVAGGDCTVQHVPDGFAEGGYTVSGMPEGAVPLGSTTGIEDLAIDDVFVTLKVYYDEDSLSSLGPLDEESIRLYWHNDATDEWIEAGNASNVLVTPELNNPDARFWLDSEPTADLGDWGIDLDDNYVWANITHASVYAAAGVPEPGTGLILSMAAIAVLGRRRDRRAVHTNRYRPSYAGLRRHANWRGQVPASMSRDEVVHAGCPHGK